mgnify:CR=1 FL=1
MEIGSAITSATVADPYLLIVSERGALILLQLGVGSNDGDEDDARLTVVKQLSDSVHILLRVNLSQLPVPDLCY